MIKIHSVCLIIDSDVPFLEHYEKQRSLWKKYLNLDPQIKCYFIKLNENILDNILVDEEQNTIYVKGLESYIPGILIKTLKAMEYIFNRYDFDYLIRTNISSFWNFNIYKKCFKTPVNDLVRAPIGHHENFTFPGGSGMVISRNIVSKMITMQQNFDYNLYDDVAIGKFLFSQNINITDGENDRTVFETRLSMNELLSNIHSNIDKKYTFRVKYDRDTQDNFIGNTLYSLVYAPLQHSINQYVNESNRHL